MYSPYYNNIQSIRSLYQRCPFACKIYKSLLPETTSDMQSPVNYKGLSNFDINKLKEMLHESLYSHPYIPQNYFAHYYDRLFYEIIFEIYHYAQVELLHIQKIPSIKDCIEQLSAFQNNKTTIEQEISRNKKSLIYDFNNLKPQCTYNNKLNTFYKHMGLWDNSTPKVLPFLTPENTAIMLHSYSDSIFNMKNSKDGMLLHTVYKIIDKYLNYFSNHLTFNKEYCFYEINHIYSLIQYSKCSSQYLKSEIAHEGIRTEYFPLYIHSKLFDTPYISLIDFINETYQKDLEKIYEDPSLLRSAMIKKELLNTFWIPIINLCLKEAIFLSNKGDFEAICKICREWLASQITYQDYTYTSLMVNAKKELEGSTYPNPKEFKNRRDIRNQKYVKTGSPNHQFNIVLSKAFFYKDFPNYLSYIAPYPTTTLCTLDYCLSFIEDAYENSYNFEKSYTLKSCKEYVTSMLDPGIIS